MELTTVFVGSYNLSCLLTIIEYKSILPICRNYNRPNSVCHQFVYFLWVTVTCYWKCDVAETSPGCCFEVLLASENAVTVFSPVENPIDSQISDFHSSPKASRIQKMNRYLKKDKMVCRWYTLVIVDFLSILIIRNP